MSRTVLAAGYSGGLLAGTLLVRAQDESTRGRWLDWLSTSVANLTEPPFTGHPVSALVGSAFVIEDGHPFAWAVLAASGLAALSWRLGPWRALAVVATAHVLATAVSEGIVGRRVQQGALPDTARHLIDVGPSYVVVAALIGALVAGPRACRVVGALGFAVLAPSLFGGLTELDVAAVGHVCSVVLGAGLALALRPRAAAGTRTAGSVPDRVVDTVQPGPE